MTKTQIEIEIPDGHEVTGIMPITTGMFSHHKHGWISELDFRVLTRPAKPFLINGIPSDWPELLTCDWVAKDKDERVYAYNGRRPTEESKNWHSYDGWWDITDILPIRISGPWEQSLRENPNKKSN